MNSIYIADDEIWVIIGLKKLIAKSGLPLEVIGEADNGVTALEDIKRLNPDILLADIRMPGLTGLELLQAISESKSLSTQVILVSGYAEFEYVQTALRRGAFDYLLKPVKPQDLYHVLQKFSDGLKPETENTTTEPPVSPTVLQTILKEMQTNYTSDLSLTAFAEKYDISPGHLSTLIKQELGLSFSEYITSKRMQKAKELLANEILSIQEIAAAAGYHDYFYFTKTFKKNIGLSPSKYRKELQSNKISSTVTKT